MYLFLEELQMKFFSIRKISTRKIFNNEETVSPESVEKFLTRKKFGTKKLTPEKIVQTYITPGNFLAS
jgi:hypothetical protein